jgi:hypothetical protein
MCDARCTSSYIDICISALTAVRNPSGPLDHESAAAAAAM